MFKRNTVTATVLSAFVFTTLCLLSSAITARAQVEPQQGAINTTRSNMKNTSKTERLDGRIDTLKVELARYGGAQFGSSGAMGTFRSIKTNQTGEFELGVLPEGRYVLRFSVAADVDSDATDRKAGAAAPEKLKEQMADLNRLNVTLNGVVGGTLKQDLGTKVNSLDTKLDSEVARAGKPKYKDVTFKTDGKSDVKGKVIINSIAKPD
jgi:hypothetical protein